jgi:hypothetical protein
MTQILSLFTSTVHQTLMGLVWFGLWEEKILGCTVRIGPSHRRYLIFIANDATVSHSEPKGRQRQNWNSVFKRRDSVTRFQTLPILNCLNISCTFFRQGMVSCCLHVYTDKTLAFSHSRLPALYWLQQGSPPPLYPMGRAPYDIQFFHQVIIASNYSTWAINSCFDGNCWPTPLNSSR